MATAVAPLNAVAGLVGPQPASVPMQPRYDRSPVSAEAVGVHKSATSSVRASASRLVVEPVGAGLETGHRPR